MAIAIYNVPKPVTGATTLQMQERMQFYIKLCIVKKKKKNAKKSVFFTIKSLSIWSFISIEENSVANVAVDMHKNDLYSDIFPV